MEVFKIEGASELAKVFQALPAHMEKPLVEAALREGAKVIAEEARRIVVKDTGDLAESIVVAAPPRKLRIFGMAHIVVGFKRPASRRAHLTEYGTKYQFARPFMRPAIAAKGQEAITAIGIGMGKLIERAATRAAGKYSKSIYKPRG